MKFSVYGPCRGVTGYDNVVRNFLKEWNNQGIEVKLTEFQKWSSVKTQTPIDNIISKCENAVIHGHEVDFHLNFCLMDQGNLLYNTMNCIYTMFESDRICTEWVECAKKYDLIIVPTEFNRQSFINSGIPHNKVAVCHVPMDFQSIQATPETIDVRSFNNIDLSKYKNRFLNISECIGRKNTDFLIKLWCEVTKPEDDACLLLKLNDNTGSRIDFLNRKVKELTSNKNCAPIFFYGDFLSDVDIHQLHHWCTHYITTSFGEGWGMSEASCAILGKKIIAPNSSAFTEYLTEENAYLVKTQPIGAKQSGPTCKFYFGSKWFAPVYFSSKKVLRQAIEDGNKDDFTKNELIKENMKNLGCDSSFCASNIISLIRNHIPKRDTPMEVQVTKEKSNNFSTLVICKSLQTKCGIADYATKVYHSIRKESNNHICLGRMLAGGEAVEYRHLLDNALVNVLNLQLEYQFISPQRLSLLLDYCNNSNIIPTVTMHTVNPQAWDYHKILKNCNVIVSSNAMKNALLEDCGFTKEELIKVIPMGMDPIVRSATKEPNERFTIGFFGFAYPHKGIGRLLNFARMNPDKDCRILATKPSNDSGYFDEIFKVHQELPNVQWNCDYLEEVVIVDELAKCDLIFLPYSEYGGIGVSAAIRTCLKAGVPIVAFDNTFFNDIIHDNGLVTFIHDDPEEFYIWSKKLNEYIDNMKNAGIEEEKDKFEAKRNEFAMKYCWDYTAREYLQHFQNLVLNK